MKKLIKICGVNNKDILHYLIDKTSVNFIGFIFYEKSPRFANLNFLNQIKNIDFKDKQPVCVYVDPQKNLVTKTSSYFKKPILQFHGNETNEFCKSFEYDFWKTIRISDIKSFDSINHYEDAEAILLETYKKNQYGGTGESFNWELLSQIKNDKNFVLSGGINFKNVDNANKTKTWCIDINSSLEKSKGEKSIDLINHMLKKLSNE